MSQNKINNYFIRKLANLPVSADAPAFDKFASKSEQLTALGIDSDEKFRKHFLIKKASKHLSAKLSDEEKIKLLKFNINNLNDAYYNIVNIKFENNGMKKIAYPNFGGFDEGPSDEFNVDKWLKVVHLIYDSIAKEEMTKENALDYYSNLLDIDEDEDVKFRKWFKYYSDGEHLKYSTKRDESMKKKSVYISDLGQGNSPYYSGGGSAYLNKATGYNMPGDSFDEVSSGAQQGVKDRDAFGGWKSKLHTAIRRIDKLLRTDKYIDPDTYKILAEHLMNLSLQVHMLKLSSTLSDVTYKAANTFVKLGYSDGAEVLKKLAQEVPEQLPPEAPAVPQQAAEVLPGETASPPALPEEATDPLPGSLPEEGLAAEPEPEKAAGPDIPGPDEVEPVKLKDITPIPGARANEYAELAGDLGLDDAARKLDEVAGMLADRRIIRQLAEFDIMLDKIGIASLFPELAESQSKLIDAFSYALTRVTKMMGQLSNAKTLVKSQSTIPGASEDLEQPSEEPEAVPEEAGELNPLE